MTSQQEGDAALAAYWAAKKLIESCFEFPTKEEFDQTMRCVYEEFPCVISTSPSPLPSSEVFSSDASYDCRENPSSLADAGCGDLAGGIRRT